MKQYNLGKIFFYIIGAAGLILGVMTILKPDKNPEIDKINAKIHKLDSLNSILSKRDSTLTFKLDSLKINYNDFKAKFKKHGKDYDDTRSTITLPDL